MKRVLAALALALALALAALARATPAAAQEDVWTTGDGGTTAPLLIAGTTDIAAFRPALEAFANLNPDLPIRYEQWGSLGLFATAEAACRGEGPAADLLISSAVDLQVRLVNDGCARTHRSALTAALPPARNWRNEVFGVTEEPAVIVYNRALVSADEAPASRFDMIDLLRASEGRYDGKVATYDIETSGLGYLFAFADAQQAATFGRLLEAFGRSGVTMLCCSSAIIDGVAEGRYLIAYNVLGSYAASRAAGDPRIAVVTPADYTLTLSRAALIPARANDPAAAGRFIDFLLSDAGRAILGRSGLIAAPGAADASGTSAQRPIALGPALLAGLDQQTKKSFIRAWRNSLTPD